MLKTPIVHPGLLAALAALGHGSRILIADGNYPARTKVPSSARRIELNFSPGVLDVVTVTRGILSVAAVEGVVMMEPMDGSWPEVQQSLKDLLPPEMPLQRLRRPEFYGLASDDDTGVVIVTADVRRFANILLTVGTFGLDASR